MRLFNFLKKKNREQAQTDARSEPVAKKSAEQETRKIVPAAPVRADKIIPGVLLRPLVTEKGTHLEALGTYQFAVANHATKDVIKRAFEARYGVRPSAVRVMHRKGKAVRFGKTRGCRSDWKRALVKVPHGAVVNIHEGV